MGIYEIDTLKSSLKKYAVVCALSVGAGLLLSNCTLNSTRLEPENSSLKDSYRASDDAHKKTQELTREEQRLQVFDTYTRSR